MWRGGGNARGKRLPPALANHSAQFVGIVAHQLGLIRCESAGIAVNYGGAGVAAQVLGRRYGHTGALERAGVQNRAVREQIGQNITAGEESSRSNHSHGGV